MVQKWKRCVVLLCTTYAVTTLFLIVRVAFTLNNGHLGQDSYSIQQRVVSNGIIDHAIHRHSTWQRTGEANPKLPANVSEQPIKNETKPANHPKVKSFSKEPEEYNSNDDWINQCKTPLPSSLVASPTGSFVEVGGGKKNVLAFSAYYDNRPLVNTGNVHHGIVRIIGIGRRVKPTVFCHLVYGVPGVRNPGEGRGRGGGGGGGGEGEGENDHRERRGHGATVINPRVIITKATWVSVGENHSKTYVC